MKAIIFDFDGVIEDNYELHYALSKQQIVGLTREEHRTLFEGNIHIEREKLKSRNTGFDFVTPFNNSKKEALIAEDIKSFLKEHADLFVLGIISSAQEYGINAYLKNNEIDDLFDFVYGKNTHLQKTEKFKLCFSAFDLGPSDCIFVTDTLGDIREANEVGVRSIAVDFGYHERERLEKGNPLGIVSSVFELADFLKSHG